MATTIRPGQFSDFHAVGRRTGLEADLAGQEFLTHCPPDLPPRHRIVALLGTTDDKGEASPAKDGWFVSDFYLFHHLLSPETSQRKCFGSNLYSESICPNCTACNSRTQSNLVNI
jgi:hypothetical protein